MKKLCLLFLFYNVALLGQGNRFVYEYQFAKNLAKKDTLKKEMMYLDIKKDGSNFYSRQKFVSDSIRTAYFQKQRAAGATSFFYSDSNAGIVDHRVVKTYPDYDIILHTRAGDTKYAVKNEKPIVWKIETDKKKIDKFDVQKATTEFGGRSWTAWFAQELPFQDGPYKFSGLPGLILELEDSTQTHIYKFIGNKKFDEVEQVDKPITPPAGSRAVSFGLGSGKELEVNENKFRQLWKDYKNDPVKEIRQMLSQNNVKMPVSMNGKNITDNAEMIRSMEKMHKQMIKEDNNPIEPDLYP